jgi:hypothetical protein
MTSQQNCQGYTTLCHTIHVAMECMKLVQFIRKTHRGVSSKALSRQTVASADTCRFMPGYIARGLTPGPAAGLCISPCCAAALICGCPGLNWLGSIIPCSGTLPGAWPEHDTVQLNYQAHTTLLDFAVPSCCTKCSAVLHTHHLWILSASTSSTSLS